MAFPNVTINPFPDVPLASGVPPVARSILFPPTPTPPPLASDAPGVSDNSSAPQWGLFDSQGNVALTADTFVSFEFMGEYRDSDFPLEEGAFASYDKVQIPFEARIVLAQAGSTQDRAQFLTNLETVRASLDLYTVVTPDASYESVNVHHVHYARKSDKGVSLIVADIWLVQIRVTGTQAFSNTAAPSGTDATSGGTVQATTPTPAQTSAAQPPAGT